MGKPATTPGTGDPPATPPPPAAPPTPPPTAPDDAPEEAGEEDEAFDKERAMATIKNLRDQAKLATKQIREYTAQQKLAEDAKLSEQERLSKRVAELESRESSLQQAVRERTLRYEVAVHAQKLGIVDADAAFRLMDQQALEFDEEGAPTNTEKVLGQMLKTRPYLQASAGPPPVPGTTNGASRARGPEGARIYKASELSDTAFFQANRADIQRAMNEGRVLADQ